MKSSQLLILGNGFDVHCGLKSQYKDFFRSEILDTRSEPFGIIQTKAGVSGFWEEILLEYYKIKNKDDYNWCGKKNKEKHRRKMQITTRL